MPYPRLHVDTNRPTTDSIRRLPPNERLKVAIDQQFLWENLDDAWKAGATITLVSPGGATAWTGLAALLDAWGRDEAYWQGSSGDHRVDYLVEQSERLIEAGVPVDGNTQPHAGKHHNASFLEVVARQSRGLKGRLDPVMTVLVDAGANPMREDAWHSAVEWCARDKRPGHPLHGWQVRHEQDLLREELNRVQPAAAPRDRPRI